MYVVVRWYKCGCTTSIRITILWKLVRKVSFRHLLCLGKKEKKIEDNFFIEMGGKYLIEKIDGFTYASIRFRGYWFPYFKCILDIYRKSNFLKRVEDEIWFIGFYPIPKSMLKFRRRVKKGGFFFRIDWDSPRQITAILKIAWILYDYDAFAPSIQHIFNQQFFFIFVIFWPTGISTIMSQFFVIII